MQHPKIGDYYESIGSPFGRFRTINGLNTRLDERGNIDFIAGSGAVVFPVEIGGKRVSVKCYTKPFGGRKQLYDRWQACSGAVVSPYLVAVDYREEEIFVYDAQGNGRYYPVLLSEWVEGISLEKWLTEKCARKEREELMRMAERFARMGRWLLEQEFAHGDVKPENIIVTERGDLKLIDYDGCYVPAMVGEKAPELGTPGFQHPGRTREWFDHRIDDYSIALIATGLYALAEFPEWYAGQERHERLLFDPAEAVAGRSGLLNRLKEYWLGAGNTVLYRLAALLGSKTPELPALAGVLDQVLSGRKDVRQGITEENMAVFRSEGLYGFRDEFVGREIAPVYDDARSFCGGLAAVRIGKRWFYIDPEGKRAVEAKGFDRVGDFREGRAVVRKGKKWGFIDRKGSVVIPLLFEEAGDFSGSRAAVKLKGKWGYIDDRGEIVISPEYISAFAFREGVAVVETETGFGYINPAGKFLTHTRFSFASGFRHRRALAEQDGKEIKLTKNNSNHIDYER